MRNGRALATTLCPWERGTLARRQCNYNKLAAPPLPGTPPSVDARCFTFLLVAFPFSPPISTCSRPAVGRTLSFTLDAVGSRLKLNPANVTVGYIRSLVCGRMPLPALRRSPRAAFRARIGPRAETAESVDREIVGPQRGISDPLLRRWRRKGSRNHRLICTRRLESFFPLPFLFPIAIHLIPVEYVSGYEREGREKGKGKRG